MGTGLVKKQLVGSTQSRSHGSEISDAEIDHLECSESGMCTYPFFLKEDSQTKMYDTYDTTL